MAGPAIYLNWLAHDRHEPWLGAQEFPLFTDAHVTGQMQFGPYDFLNAIALPQAGVAQPAITLRISWHTKYEKPDWRKTDASFYHGGSVPEEIAAITALVLGIRCRAASSTRDFDVGGDPKGLPRALWHDIPSLPQSRARRGRILPAASEGSRAIADLGIFGTLPCLSPSEAIAVIRAARFYQDSLWLAESETSLSWLMLVSALETAANQWRTNQDSPVERLRGARPKLFEYLLTLREDAPAKVADEIVDSLGSTKKFVDFVLEFLPSPPSARPSFWQLPWDAASMRNAMRLIYGYRSKALHDGVPFPAPMCEAPYRLPEWQAPAEKPGGLATSSLGGTWLATDTPMLFHTFEYIARNVLLGWWRHMAQARALPESS